MKTIIVLLMTMLVSYSAFAQSETLTVPLSKPGEQYTLKVSNFSGMIRITGTEARDITINVTPGGGEEKDDDESDRPENARGMKKLSADQGFEVTAKEADNVVTVNSGNINKVINLELKIPQNVKLEAGTVTGGEVVIDNISGDIEIHSVNDDVKLSGISGSVVANSVAGNVSVKFKSFKPDTPMAFSSVSGDVNVEIPADAKAKVKMKSDHGDVYSDFDIELEAAPKKTEKVSQPGLYQIKKDSWIYGKINGGGAELMFKTLSGDIYLKKTGK